MTVEDEHGDLADVVARYLDERDLPHEGTGAPYVVSLGGGEARGLVGPGPGGGSLLFQAFSRRPVPRAAWFTALFVGNRWNERVRTPKVWLAVRDWEHGQAGTLVVEGNLPLPASEEPVARFLNAMFAGAAAFWTRSRSVPAA